jgi:hypothetical protein
MTWIQTDSPENPVIAELMEKLRKLYPAEYGPGRRGAPSLPEAVQRDSIMLSHSLLPKVMYHAFALLGELFNPELPLERRQHEMIATAVSALHRCFY